MPRRAERPRGAEPDRGVAPVTGPVRPDRRIRRLLSRLRPGDIALVDHVDLDLDLAAALVAAQVGAVVNARPSLSGRVASAGPALLVGQGIPVVDDVGEEIFRLVGDGDRVTIDGDTLLVGHAVVGLGMRQTEARLAAAIQAAQAGLATRLERFAAGAVALTRRESGVILDGSALPGARTGIAGRHCLVVARGSRTARELDALEGYLRQATPVLIGVGAGADALLEVGHRPDLIVGDLDAVSVRALTSGAELVERVGASGAARARLERLDLTPSWVTTAVGAGDLALLLAQRHGASLVVTAGLPATLAEVLEGGGAFDGAATLLARLRLGGRVVDATRVAALHRPAPRTGGPAEGLAALVAVALAVAATTVGRGLLDGLADAWIGAL